MSSVHALPFKKCGEHSHAKLDVMCVLRDIFDGSQDWVIAS